ncbi:MAG TPA: DUF177 domain-containing protein [Hyphomicrobiaceae bacterium]|nr:DUF177 domain-containing protein [Hyphomicrobiaceae bacterium]
MPADDKHSIDEPSSALAWSHAIDDIGPKGVRVERAASEAECAAIARQIGIRGCRSLAVKYQIRPMAGGAYFADGKLRATVTQSCVITLEPVEETIEEPFTVEFRDASEIEAIEASEMEFDPDEPDDPEPIVAGRLMIGPPIIEHLILALDPYPRLPGATLDQTSTGTEASRDNPFAALAKLKPRS